MTRRTSNHISKWSTKCHVRGVSWRSCFYFVLLIKVRRRGLRSDPWNIRLKFSGVPKPRFLLLVSESVCVWQREIQFRSICAVWRQFNSKTKNRLVSVSRATTEAVCPTHCAPYWLSPGQAHGYFLTGGTSTKMSRKNSIFDPISWIPNHLTVISSSNYLFSEIQVFTSPERGKRNLAHGPQVSWVSVFSNFLMRVFPSKLKSQITSRLILPHRCILILFVTFSRNKLVSPGIPGNYNFKYFFKVPNYNWIHIVIYSVESNIESIVRISNLWVIGYCKSNITNSWLRNLFWGF